MVSQATKRKHQRVRNMASSGLYTLREISEMCRLSYQHTAKICAGLEYKVGKMGGLHSKRDHNSEPPLNVEEAIRRVGNDDHFQPRNFKGWHAVSHYPGSRAKIATLRKRIELGQPLWHPGDTIDFSGASVGKFW